MSEPHAKGKSKSRRANSTVHRASGPAPAPAQGLSPAASAPLGGFYSAGPVVGLGVPVQRQVAIGKAGDPHEREAEATAARVISGQKVEPGDISKLEPGAISQTMPAQKAEAKPGEKKPEPRPVQKAEAKPEQKVEDKKPVQKAEAKPEEKKPEPMPVQKAEAKPEEKKPVPVPVQKAEAKPEQKVEDKKPVQKAEAKPEERKPQPSPVQRAEETPDEQPAEPGPQEPGRDEQEPVQTQPASASGTSGSSSMAAAASQAIASKSAGTPLNPATRGALESSLGADFGHVRVHDDAPARQSARDLNARAFTHGNDIWLGPGESQDDKHLMAHEATHVVQQAGGVHRMVQRATPPAAGAGGAAGKGGKGAGKDKPPAEPATLQGKVVSIPKLRLPSYDRKANSIGEWPFNLPQEKPKRPTDQRQVFTDDIANDSGFKSKVGSWLKTSKFPKVKSEKTLKENYFLRPTADKMKYLLGDEETLPAKLSLPTWDKSGKYHSYDVDHIKEIQLGGDNKPDNMELLDSSANRSSGSSINADIQSKTSAAAAQLGRQEKKISEKITDLEALRKNGYQVQFRAKDARYSVADDPKEFWPRKALKAGEQLEPLESLSKKEIEDVRGDPTRLVLINRRGLKLGEIKGWDKSKTDYAGQPFLPNFDLKTVTYDPGKGGTITGTLFPKRIPLAPKEVNWQIAEEPGIDYGGSIPVSLKDLSFTGLSPIEIFEVDLDPRGLVARGVLRPTIPLVKPGLEVDFLVEGSDITLSKTFTASDFSFPGPIQVSSASLTISFGTRGLEAEGDVFLEVERLGKGQITGRAGTSGGLELSGSFDFDSKLFDPARITLGYAHGKFSGIGEIGIPPGKVKGIQSADIKAKFEGANITATGSVKPSIPGVEQADMHMSYAPEAGLVIGGTLELRKDIPGIAGGSVSAEVSKKPGAEDYIVKASGQAKPKIPGIDTTLSVTYDDGTFDVTGTANYAKGMLSGSVTVGATNRTVDQDGKPGSPSAGKSDKITLYGGGSVALKIAPWLQATAGIRLLPNGEVEVTGEIGLPKTLDIFPEKKLDKNILTIGIDIPIVGVAVAGQRIGIFANIRGGLDLSAGIGPSQLQELGLKVTYNPAHEDQTKIHGGAKLHIPAHAGLRLFVRGSLGVGIPIVSAQAGLEIGGQLGLEGALDAGVQVDWTPAKGLKLEAFGEIYAEPKFKFDVTGFVLVEANVLVTTIELYSKRWQLAAFEYGSGLRLGVKFPVKYEEGKPFDISLSDVQFQVPEIKPKELLSDLVKKIA